MDKTGTVTLDCKHEVDFACLKELAATRYSYVETKSDNQNPYVGSFPLAVPTFSRYCPVCRQVFDMKEVFKQQAQKFSDPEQLEKFIMEHVEHPGFDMIAFYLMLPEGRDEKSPRQRVLVGLSEKAEKLVRGKEEKELNGLFEVLSEGWYKMEVRRLFHVIKGVCIDQVPINKILEKINAIGPFVTLKKMKLALPLKSIVDLLIIRDEEEAIIQLDLSKNRFTGSIPSELINLTQLVSLCLNNNRLTGFIPPKLGCLENLIGLYLCKNKLTGVIPPELGHLKQLAGLYLNNNRLVGSIPPALSKLVQLDVLDLSNNRLTGFIPVVMFNLMKITKVKLKNNNFDKCFLSAAFELIELGAE